MKLVNDLKRECSEDVLKMHLKMSPSPCGKEYNHSDALLTHAGLTTSLIDLSRTIDGFSPIGSIEAST